MPCIDNALESYGREITRRALGLAGRPVGVPVLSNVIQRQAEDQSGVIVVRILGTVYCEVLPILRCVIILIQIIVQTRLHSYSTVYMAYRTTSSPRTPTTRDPFPSNDGSIHCLGKDPRGMLVCNTLCR